MELSLDDLLSGLEEAQQKKSKVRLSERNVVELVNKVKQLGLLGDDLLYTTNGREYVTRQRAEAEVRAAVRAAGGRIPLVDLPTHLGLDLVHCERAAEAAVAGSGGALTAAQGELFSAAYFDGLAAEVDEALQEAGVVAVGDLARRFGLGAEMIGGVLAAHMGGAIRGRLEAGAIYTPAHLARLKAQLRGALRGAVSPLGVPGLARELGVEGLASLAALVPGLVEELAGEGAVAGKLSAGGASWVPASYVAAQQGAVKRFFQQNGHIGYDTVKQYGIPAPRVFLAQHFPDGLALDSAFVSPAVVDQVEAAVEEALGGGGWCDVQPHLPSALSPADAAELLARCRAVAAPPAAPGGPPRVLAGTCVVAGGMLAALREQSLEAARQAADEAHRRQKKGGGAGVPPPPKQQQEGKKAAAAAAPAAGSGSDDDDWGAAGKKGKKGGRGKKAKGGGGGGGGGGAKPAKGGGKAGGGQAAAPGADGGPPALSLASLAARVAAAHPDTEGAGAEGDLPLAIARELRPAAVAEYERALQAIWTAGAERRRRAQDAAQAALVAAHERLSLFAHGAELFVDDEAAAAVLQRHLLRGPGADAADALLRFLAVDAAAGEEEEAEGGAGAGGGPLSPAERAALLKPLPPDVKPAAAAMVDGLGGGSLEAFQRSLEAAAEAAGLRLRRLDKRSERAAVFAQRKAWEAAAAGTDEPSALLAIVVPLLIARQHGRAVSLPGRALAAGIDLLRAEALPEGGLQLLADFHAAVVRQLKLQSAGADGEEADEAAAALERLAPRVRALAEPDAGGDAA